MKMVQPILLVSNKSGQNLNRGVLLKNILKQGYLLRAVGLLCVLVFTSSCGFLFGGDNTPNTTDESALKTELTGESVTCSESNRCNTFCKKMFSAELDRLEKCLKFKSSGVGDIHTAYSSMERGRWSAIKAEYMQVLTEFDDQIWPEFAQRKNKISAREMLLWVAKQKEVALLLDKGDEEEGSKILKNAFSVLGEPAEKDKAVIKGMEKKVETAKNQNFFQTAVMNKNDEAFKAGHTLLTAECKSQKSCIKSFYCDTDEDIVFGKLNTLGLGKEISGGGLFRSNCNSK